MLIDPDKLYTVKEGARALRLGLRTMWRRIKSADGIVDVGTAGKPAVRIPGRVLLAMMRPYRPARGIGWLAEGRGLAFFRGDPDQQLYLTRDCLREIIKPFTLDKSKLQ